MAEEFTRADLKQNKEINAEKVKVRSVEERLKALEDADARRTKVLASHESRLNELDPIRGLLEFAESIKAHFANFRLR